MPEPAVVDLERRTGIAATELAERCNFALAANEIERWLVDAGLAVLAGDELRPTRLAEEIGDLLA